MTSVVIFGGPARSCALVNTADSAARQGAPVEILLALAHAGYPAGIVESIVSRLGASAVYAETSAGAVNLAVRRARGKHIVLLQPPWRLERGLTETCERILDDAGDHAAVVPAARLQSPDGRTLQTIPIEPTLAAVLADPRATAPVVVVRRSAWEHIGGLDDKAGNLASCEWWLRLLAAHLPVAAIDEPLATLTASDTDWWPPVSREPLDPDVYRAVLEKHRALLEGDLTAVLVEREVAFGRLMEQHREMMRRRNDSLADLERVRAETAHHRAYLRHHDRAAVEWGDLRRGDPVSRDWGYDRGVPIDRHYIEAFLVAHSSDIAGAVLEVQEDDFTRRFGGPRVIRSAIVDLDDSNRRATIVADLRAARGVEDAQFDCIVLTQTLHVIDDMASVLRECHRLLKPGGVLLATLPCASRVCLEYGDQGDLWRVTPAGARALFEPIFGPSNVDVAAYGSVLTNVAFLHGLACAELTEPEFDRADPYHPVLTGVRARKTPAVRHSSRMTHDGIVLLYHRVDDQPDVHDLSVPAALLEQQFSWLAENCQVMPLEDLLSGARDGLPPRAVAITFDDGYLDTLESAAPLLQRFGLPATVFATSRWLDEPGEYWWDLLERALLGGPVPARLPVEGHGTPLILSTRTDVERRAAHARLHSLLVHAALEERDRIVAGVARWAEIEPDLRRRPMTGDELRRLARFPGLSIGAHGVNHLALPDQTADARQRELVDSLSALGNVLGRRVETFAYPYGAVDRASSDLARTAYRWSVGCHASSLGGTFDAARVPRLEVKRWDCTRLAAQISRLLKAEWGHRATSPSPA